MEIPKEWKEQLPGMDLTIPMLLKFSLPRQGARNLQEPLPISALFSKETPDEHKKISNEIPPSSYIQNLRRTVEDAKALGYHSIKGGFPGTTKGSTYPLWMIHYWGHLSNAISSKGMWAHSIAWLSNCSYPPLVDEYINHLPWMKPPLSRLMFLMEDLSILLSDEWLNDSHIDFFATYFNQATTGTSPPILITPLSFSHSIKSLEQPQVSVYTAQVLKCFRVFPIY